MESAFPKRKEVISNTINIKEEEVNIYLIVLFFFLG
jgi:hypothetical protein